MIHRNMQRFYQQFAIDLDVSVDKCISRTQLRRLLISFDYERFNAIAMSYFQYKINQKGIQWHAVDGKELRGNIDGVSGEKRAENIILSTHHPTRISEVIGYYNGKKDSERTLVLDYFKSQYNLNNMAFTLDALHMYPSCLEKIRACSMGYICQLKSNQKHLLSDVKQLHENVKARDYLETIEKGHGRVDTRKAWLYTINQEFMEDK